MSANIINAVLSAGEPVSWTLIHSLWLGGIVAIILAGTLAVLRKSTPQLRYTASCIALLLILPVSLLSALHTEAGGAVSTMPSVEQGQTSTTTTGRLEKETVVAAGETGHDQGMARSIIAAQNSATPWIFLMWLMGVSLLSLYHTFGWRSARRLVHLGSMPVSDIWQERFARLCGQIGASARTRIMKSPFLRVPCVVGWIKPTILVPVSSLTGLSPEELEMIIAHELAHVRRHDVLVNYLQTAIETMLFFNPAVWWISRQIRVERELCCDELAVSIGHDRVAYARALTNLEQLRLPRPHLSTAADGASLLKRINRLVGSEKGGQRWPGFSIAGILSLVTALMVGLGAAGVLSPTDANAVTNIENAQKYEEQSDDIHGKWKIDPEGRYLHLEMRFSRNGQSSFVVGQEQLAGLTEGNDIQFQLVRDAGTFFFEGSVEIDDGDYYGDGECHFRANQDYAETLDKLGIRIGSNKKSLKLAIHDVDLGFAQGLADLGYGGILVDRLIELHIHDVSPEYIRDLADLGYHDLDLDRLVEMRIHKVTPEYIRGLQEQGYEDISPARLVEMRIHSVEPYFVSGLAKLGYRDIDPSKLVEMSIHRVSPDYIRGFKELGYEHIPLSKLVEMRIHRVEPDYVRELIALGYDGISPSKLVEMRIHNVDIDFIKQLKELGYEHVDPSDLVSMRIHNVTPKYIERLQQRGHKNLSPEDLIEYKVNGNVRSLDSRD